MTAPADPPFESSAAQAFARVRRMMLISLVVTVVAIGAVLMVIGYRVSRSADGGPPPDVTEMLPRGARIFATSVGDGRIVITIEAGGETEIRSFDLKTLKPVGRLRLPAAP